MVVEATPAPAHNRASVSENVIGQSKPGLVEECSGGESTERHRRVFGVRQETAECRRGRATRIVPGRIKDRIAKVLTVDPWREMREAHTDFDGQFPHHLPRILSKELIGVVRDVIE